MWGDAISIFEFEFSVWALAQTLSVTGTAIEIQGNVFDRCARICFRPALPLGAQMPSNPGIVLPYSTILAISSDSTSHHCDFLPVPCSSVTPAAMALHAPDTSSPNLAGSALLTTFSVRVLSSSVSTKLMARFTGVIMIKLQ